MQKVSENVAMNLQRMMMMKSPWTFEQRLVFSLILFVIKIVKDIDITFILSIISFVDIS